MYEFFIYDTLTTQISGGRPQRLTVVFCPVLKITEEDMFAALKSHLAKAIPPDVIFLLGTVAQVPTFKAIRDSVLIRDSLPSVTRYVSPPSIEAAYLEKGELRFLFGDENTPRMSHLAPILQQAGLMAIFNKRVGILESGGAFHYVKPSGKHCDKFVRAANVLICGAEVHFIAFWLLYSLKRTSKRIYTDTAAINIVAQSLMFLGSQTSMDFDGCTVDSFSSYEGEGRFAFELADDCIVLVSASTSGDLERSLHEKHKIPRRNIWTLFYLGLESSQAIENVLCRLRKSIDNPTGYELISSWSSDGCPLCDKGLIPITIAGDQFLPEGAKISECLITVADQPKWLNDFCKDFVGKGLIRANCLTGDGAVSRELFLNLKDVYSNSSESIAGKPSDFLSRMDRLITQTVSSTTNRIIYVDDQGSQALALRIQHHLSNTTSQAVSLVSSTSVSKDLESHRSDEGTTLVVAGAVVTGRQLLAISQALRRIQSNRSIQYFIGLARCQSQEICRELKKNLQYGDFGPEDYDVRCVREIWIPGDVLERHQPWMQERKALQALSEELMDDSAALNIISKRIEILDSSEANGGLQCNLFLSSSVDGSRLLLRPNFAFWKFEYKTEKTSQSDVYFTICSILHYRRNGIHDLPLRNLEHHRVVLSPICFERFNDGILQACFLRSANRSELDYSVNSSVSKRMTETIRFVLANRNSQSGEASSEFLLALVSGKLQLDRKDLDLILADLKSYVLDGWNRIFFHALERKAKPK